MTHEEIKKAWNLFKKEIAKEIDVDLTGCCYMNKKQIENGTATITIGNDLEFDWLIQHDRESIAKVNSYDSWTTEEKQRHEQRTLTYIADYEARKAKHGTKANEINYNAEQVLNSTAFKKLAETISIEDTGIELVKGVYQIRIYY